MGEDVIEAEQELSNVSEGQGVGKELQGCGSQEWAKVRGNQYCRSVGRGVRQIKGGCGRCAVKYLASCLRVPIKIW